MATESSAVRQMNSVEEGNLEDIPFDWLAELLDHIDGETDDEKAGLKDVVKKEAKGEAKESIDAVVGNKASCALPALPKQDCIPLEGVKPVSGDESDDDCLILDADPDKPVAFEDDKMNGSDDLFVVSVKGPIACRDYPHSRHLCAKFPFTSTPHEKHCNLCHCYVCDSLAPCILWGSGISSADHCHSNDKEEIWRIMRKISKEGGSTTLSIQKLLDVTLSTTPAPAPSILDPMNLIQIPPSINVVPQQTLVSKSLESNACSAVFFRRENVTNHKQQLYAGPTDDGSRFAECLDRQFTPGPVRVNGERRWCETANAGSQLIPTHAKRVGSSIGAFTATNPSIHSPPNINQENGPQARTHSHGQQFIQGDSSNWKMVQEFLSTVELEPGSFQGNCHCSNSSLGDTLLPALSSQAQGHSCVPSGNYHGGGSVTDVLLPAVSSQAQVHSHVPAPQTFGLNIHESGFPVMNFPNKDLIDISLSHRPLALGTPLPTSGSLAFVQANYQQLPMNQGNLEANLNSLKYDMEHRPSANPGNVPLLDLSLAWPPSTYLTQPDLHFLFGSQLHGISNMQQQL